MSEKINRRDFLKVAGVGLAATAILTGCGPDSRYVVRTPYTKMPEYTYNGLSTFYASTCRECPAGCGIVVRTMQGRAIKIEGNPNHPVNLGKTCSRGQAALQGLYNPDRIPNPIKQSRQGGKAEDMTWEQAIGVVQQALSANQPGEIAFLLGLAPDHLFDLVSRITAALGAPAPLRYGALAMFEARATLAKAAERVFGQPALPSFDLGGADLIFSFGANFLETYLSPMAFGRGYAAMRRDGEKRGTLVHFEPRMSQTAAAADEWVPIAPGTEGLVALGLGRAIAELRGGSIPAAYRDADLAAIAGKSGVAEDTLRRLAGQLAGASRPLVLPGGSALGSSAGFETGTAILALDAFLGAAGRPGGISLTPPLPVHADVPGLPNTFTDLDDLIERMKSGAVKALFIHGVNPLFEFPEAMEFADALGSVPLVISFASFPDETAARADYVFPDHTGLEAWGYQKVLTGGDRPVLSGAQPVVVPFQNTKATADVFLAAVQAIGGSLAQAVPFKDEVEFLQASVQDLMTRQGFFNAGDAATFWAEWQQNGGWWNAQAGLDAATPASALDAPLAVAEPTFDGEGDFYFFPFPSPILADGTGANKPWLQETPDPTTTVMWNSWVEIHPDTAAKLGVTDDDVVRIRSPFGEIEASVYKYPAIRPDTIAMPFGQGHSAYGRYAEGRGANPARLLGTRVNSAGDLAPVSMKVQVTKTGKQRPLARLESQLGVYGDFKP
jgi:anaerobic selenocysteine-containing dehydrogenase